MFAPKYLWFQLINLVLSGSLEYENLRKYEIVQTTRQDQWEVQTRKRKSGKLCGSLYKVWTSPNGTKYYSLKKAKDAGFKDEETHGSGDGGAGSQDDDTVEKKGRGRKRRKKA